MYNYLFLLITIHLHHQLSLHQTHSQSIVGVVVIKALMCLFILIELFLFIRIVRPPKVSYRP
jgi:hypothetical protein